MFSSQTSTSSICWYRSRDGDFGFQGIFRKNLSPLLYCHPIRDFSLQASRHRDTCVIAPSKSQTLSRNCLPYDPTPIRSRFIPGKSQSIFEIACLFRRATRHQPTCLACSLLFQLHAITQRQKDELQKFGIRKLASSQHAVTEHVPPTCKTTVLGNVSVVVA